MKNERGILLGWCAGFGLVAIAITLLVFESPMSACEKKQAPPTDDIRITRTAEGDVTIVVQGPTTYVGWNFYPLGNPEKEKKAGHSHLFVVELMSLGTLHQVRYLLGDAKSVRLQGVVCQIKKQETKRFEHRFGFTFVLVTGPDAEPNNKPSSVKGTFMWNSKDGEDHFFYEEGTGRAWKTVLPPENKEKKDEEKKNK